MSYTIKIFLTKKSLSSINIDDKITVHTYMLVREDEISLYGFLNKDDSNTFALLITVSGIGSKVALSILNEFTTYELFINIINEEINELSKVPGLGKKTSSRLVLELKDKITKLDLRLPKTNTNNKVFAIDALVSLGYSKFEAKKAVETVEDNSLEIEEIIKLALKYFL